MNQDLRDLQEIRHHELNKVKLVLLVQQARGESQELQEGMEDQATEESLDHLVLWVNLVKQDLLDQLVLQAPLDRQDLLDLVVRLALLVILDLMGELVGHS